MYFSRLQASALLTQIVRLLGQSGRVWFDHVSSAAVADQTGIADVKAFIDSMRTIGEPFVRGFDDVSREIACDGLEVAHSRTAQSYAATDDPVFHHYSFALARAI